MQSFLMLKHLKLNICLSMLFLPSYIILLLPTNFATTRWYSSDVVRRYTRQEDSFR